jgi:hypothetical protein
MQVPPFVRRSFVKPTDEDRRPQFVAGEFKNSAASGPVTWTLLRAVRGIEWM